MNISRRSALQVALSASLLPFGSSALSQQYPSHPLRIVVPYPAGGTYDRLARVLAKRLTASLDQTVIVDNRPGAHGMIAISAVARAAPDGYTLLLSGSSLVLNFASFKSVSYRLEDLAAVGGLVDMPLAIAVNPSFPARSFAELTAAIKAAPDEYAMSTSGTIEEIVVARVKKAAGLKFRLIPYPGAAPSLNGVMSGVVPMIITAAGAAQPLHQAGKLRVLAIAGPARLSAMPDVPTLTELGVAGGDLATWAGVLAPKETNPAIVKRLSDAIEAAMRDPQLVSELAAFSMTVHPRDAAQFARFIDAEAIKWKQAAQEAGITPQ